MEGRYYNMVKKTRTPAELRKHWLAFFRSMPWVVVYALKNYWSHRPTREYIAFEPKESSKRS